MKITTAIRRLWYKLIPARSKYTRPEALAIAKKYNLEYEVIMSMEHGCTPDEALREWNLCPY